MSRSPLRLAALALPVLLCPALSVAEGNLKGVEQVAGGAAKPYTVTVEKVAAKKGQPATAKVVITPAKGWHMNKDFPASLKLNPPAGVVAQKASLSKADANISEGEGSFQVQLVAAEAGKKSVPGDLRFAVCTDASCDPQRSAVTIEMDVK